MILRTYYARQKDSKAQMQDSSSNWTRLLSGPIAIHSNSGPHAGPLENCALFIFFLPGGLKWLHSTELFTYSQTSLSSQLPLIKYGPLQ